MDHDTNTQQMLKILHKNSSSNDICFLIENYDHVFTDLQRILERFELKYWPLKIDYLLNYYEIEIEKKIVRFIECYNKLVKENISNCNVIIAIITSNFIKSETCLELIKYSKTLNKPVIALIHQEIECFIQVKNDKLTGIDYFCELYHDRIYETGYDPYIWTGGHFNYFIKKLEIYLNRNIKRSIECNDISFHYSICNKTTFDANINVSKIFCKIKKEVSCFQLNHNNMNYIKYMDLSKVDLNGLTNVLNKYNDSVLIINYEANLKISNIENFNDYLTICRLYYSLLQPKIAEIKIKNDDDCDLASFDNSKEDDIDVCLRHRIEKIQNSLLSGYNEVKEMNLMLKNEFEKMNLDFDLINKVIDQMDAYNVKPFYIYFDMLDSKLVVFFLTQQFYETDKFKKLLKRSIVLNKTIFVLKLDKFEFKVEEEYEKQLSVYNLYLHKDDNFEGYESKRMVSDLKNIFMNELYHFNYDLQYDVLLCNINDTSNKMLVLLNGMFEKNKLKCKYSVENLRRDGKYNQVFELIEKSRLIVFVLTNIYVKSNEFQNELLFAKQERKPIIFLLFEQIDFTLNRESSISLNEFNVIEVYKCTYENALQGEMIHRFLYLTCSIINKENFIEYRNEQIYFKNNNSEIHSNNYSFLTFQKIRLKKTIESQLPTQIFYFKENNHICVITRSANSGFCKQTLTVYNRENFNLINSFEMKKLIGTSHLIHEICFYKSLDNLVLVGETVLFLFHRNYIFHKNVVVFSDLDRIISVKCVSNTSNAYVLCYYKNETAIRIYNNEFGLIKHLNFKEYVSAMCEVYRFEIFNECVLVFTTQKILVFDLDIELKAVVENYSLKKDFNILVDPRPNNFLHMIPKLQKSEWYIFNTSTYKLHNKKFQDNQKFAEKISISSSNFFCVWFNKNSYIYEIEDDEFVCQELSNFYCTINNQLKPHLLKEPYKLSCGNLACLKCIYDNYNLYTNTFICPTCKQKHVIDVGIEKSKIFENSLKHVCALQLKYLDENFRDQVQYENDIMKKCNDIFEYIENEIEIRIESIKKRLEELSKDPENVKKLKEQLLVKLVKITKSYCGPKKKKAKLDSYSNILKVMENHQIQFKPFGDIDKSKIYILKYDEINFF